MTARESAEDSTQQISGGSPAAGAHRAPHLRGRSSPRHRSYPRTRRPSRSRRSDQVQNGHRRRRRHADAEPGRRPGSRAALAQRWQSPTRPPEATCVRCQRRSCRASRRSRAAGAPGAIASGTPRARARLPDCVRHRAALGVHPRSVSSSSRAGHAAASQPVLDRFSRNRDAARSRDLQQPHGDDRIADLMFAAKTQRHRSVRAGRRGQREPGTAVDDLPPHSGCRARLRRVSRRARRRIGGSRLRLRGAGRPSPPSSPA